MTAGVQQNVPNSYNAGEVFLVRELVGLWRFGVLMMGKFGVTRAAAVQEGTKTANGNTPAFGQCWFKAGRCFEWFIHGARGNGFAAAWGQELDIRSFALRNIGGQGLPAR